MLFTLVKNELIKLLKKGKTWIVFVLFVVFIGITVYGQYSGDKNMREWQSPQKQIEIAHDELKYINDEIELNKGDTKNPDYTEYLKSRKEELMARIKEYEDILKNGIDENGWKIQLNEEIRNLKEQIKNYEQYDDEWSVKYKQQAQEELEMYEYLKDNNISPLYGWEYDSYNYMKSLMQFLGMAILVAGIAVFMSDIVSGECTPATLKFLLIQPVTRGKVLLSKFIAVTLTVLSMILGAEIFGFLFVNITSGVNSSTYPVNIGMVYEKIINSDGTTMLSKVVGSGHMGTNLELLIKAMLFQGLFIITACAVIFMISTLIKSSMITMAISVVVTVFLTIGSYNLSALRKIAHLVFLNFGDSISVFTGSSAMMLQNPNITATNGIIVMIITSIVAYAIAYINFSKKDILI
ncbi:ABC-type transport system involved in multi-copper enzyme maturation%2C permease component [uncultured Clostridium sp.]|uniref:ABC transporter permease subunit n=1 Tax=uncultured Clostridium sp. TaxID=59620 RepID=UPI0008224FCC|nr:ABC transporter permease subunit [uncultured Clostridium sp.]SCJ93199.1 ABC-type transport system involved in multi-copper enzyme maturation%2C permease component [uncultured Clostridium sp.]